MEFPITKYRLQNYTTNEAALAETKKLLSTVIRGICNGVEQTVLTSNANRYVYHNHHQPPTNYKRYFINKFKFRDDLLGELQTLFPDSRIIIDHHETFIIIDWS